MPDEKKKRAPKSIDQTIADLEARLEKARSKRDEVTTHIKVVIGSIVLKKAAEDALFAKRLLPILQEGITRDSDKAATAGLLKAIQEKAETYVAPPPKPAAPPTTTQGGFAPRTGG